MNAVIRKCGTAIRGILGHYDYQSGSLASLPSDFESFFPYVVHRRPHNWYVPHTGRCDKRFPTAGLLTLDEATILFNYGRLLQGGTAIEVGCWVGWSTLALATSGAQLIAIDPVLAGQPQGQSCRESLRMANELGHAKLIGAPSQVAMPRLAASGVFARGLFIDGDHEGSAPLRDCMDSQEIADADCIIILHDMLQPNIARGLTWLEGQGWKCGIHCTSQVLGVAWRGSTSPLICAPDPNVDWSRLIRDRWPHLSDFRCLE